MTTMEDDNDGGEWRETTPPTRSNKAFATKSLGDKRIIP
jgi:hypothetical protein